MRLQRLLCPRSVALIGGSACAQVVRQSRLIGFEGHLWPIHPNLRELEGLSVYRSVAELPRAADAAFVAVNRHATIEVMRALAAGGTGGAICYASGFAEMGTAGGELQAQLAAAAGPMPFIGPNCHGFINYFDGVALWPEQHGGTRQTRGVAIVTQSGNIALNLTMQTRALPIGYIVTLGNQARIGLADVIEALLDDGRVTAIGLHIEGIHKPAEFVRAANLAQTRGVPLVAVKSGRSDLGASLALSHTASLGGADAVAEAFLHRARVARVHSLPVFLETLKVLHVHGPLAGRDIASMSCSGGEAALMADAVGARNLRFPAFTREQAQRVADTLPELATVTNPLDYHNFSWDDEAALADTYAAVMQATFNLTLLILDFPRQDRCSQLGFERALRAFVTAARQCTAQAAVVSTLPESFPEHRAQQLLEAGIVPLCGLDDALAAIEAAAQLGEYRRTAPLPFAPPSSVGNARGCTLSEPESKRRLARFGLRVPAGAPASTADDAIAAARAIGYPVALKSVGSGMAHKTEIGAVCLDLRDGSTVGAAAAQQLAVHQAELLVEEMITDGVAELLVGVGRDSVFGLYLVIGSGGILVELLGDRRILMLPATATEIRAAIDSLKAGELMRGYRGRAAGDREAAVAAVLVIQEFALEQQDRLLELDVNPLIVRPRGCGVVAVDALIRLAGERSHA